MPYDGLTNMATMRRSWSGLRPYDYYALGEQRSGDLGPEVLTRHAETAPSSWRSTSESDDTKMVAVAEQPPNVSLALVSYCAKIPIMAYVEPISTGSPLPEMPLFLTPGALSTF